MYEGKTIKRLKEDLGQSIVNMIVPIQENYRHLKENPEYVNVVRELGRQKAEYVALNNIEYIKKCFGL